MGESLPRQIFPTGAEIFVEGEAGHFSYVIERGEVEISTSNQGRRVVLARLGEGELFGEMALVDGGPRPATATAIAETQAVVIERVALQSRIAQADELLQLVVRVIMQRLRTMQQAVDSGSAADLGGQGRAEQLSQRRALEADLEKAIEQESLNLHYQPIVHLADGRVTGFEALIRWDHPEHGTVVPSSFIRLAEETGMIVPMGRWMLKQALGAQKQLQAALNGAATAIQMNVNVSSRQLLSGAEVGNLEDIVQQSGVPPKNVTFEITETLMIEEPNSVSESMHRLRKQGIRIAADDFGTGSANLAFLHRFPLDILKIDRSFVTNMAAEPRSRKIVSTIITLAKELGMSIVAEGIESASEIGVLRELGCDFGQGFMLSRPVPLEAAEALVTRRVRW